MQIILRYGGVIKMKMKAIYLIILFFFIGCGNAYHVNKGGFTLLKGKSYTFSDSDIRNLELSFLNDSLISISNRVAGLQSENYYLYNFEVNYKVEKIDLYRYILHNLNNNEDSLEKEKYVLPYRKSIIKDKLNVFPNLDKDTIFFSGQYKTLLIKEFSFELKK